METFTRSKSVHPVPLSVVSLISCPIASSVPRLKTNERSDLSWRRPNAHHRSIESHSKPRSSINTEHTYLIDLRILKHDGIDSIECVCCNRKKAVRRNLKRIFYIHIHAAFLLDADALKAFGLAKAQEATLGSLGGIIRIIESRMRTDLEIYRL